MREIEPKRPLKEEMREAGQAIRAYMVAPVEECITPGSIAAACAFVGGMFAYLIVLAVVIPAVCP